MRRIRIFLAFLLALSLALAAAGPAGAQTSPAELITGRPAATLLLPYFEVDLAKATGANTVFTVNNASATAVLAHVTLWTDLAVPVLGFNVYLTGYDVQTVNLRSVLSGTLPQTASAGQDFADTVSPQGILSQDINFASCTGQLPPPALPAAQVTGLRRALRGLSSSILGGQCGGLARGDQVARGYVTVDTVNNCTLRSPADAGYFVNGGAGDATNQNVLWGEFFYQAAPAAAGAPTLSQAGALVAIRAYPGYGVDGMDASEAQTATAGEYTFYGRYVGWSAADNRQPLAARFGARYFSGGRFGTPTEIVAWRDPKVAQGPFACGTLPAWYPLRQNEYLVFDEQEQAYVPPPPMVFPAPPAPGALPFPAAAQRVKIGTKKFAVPYSFGWMYFNLNTYVGELAPTEDPWAAQAWVSVIQDPRGRFNMGHAAMQLESAAETTHMVVGW